MNKKNEVIVMENKKETSVRFVVDAQSRLNNERTFDENAEKWRFLHIENQKEEFGVAPTVCFTIQSDPVSEVGVNGLQATDMLHYVKCLFESLNDRFPCAENELTIQKLQEAIYFQHARTVDRIKRQVEGT